MRLCGRTPDPPDRPALAGGTAALGFFLTESAMAR